MTVRRIIIYSALIGVILPMVMRAQLDAWTLTVDISGSGVGTISGAGTIQGDIIDCGEICDGVFFDDETITLTATPAAGSVFTGWSNDCSDADPTCSFMINEDTTIGAVFTVAPTAPPQRSGGAANERDSAAFDFINKIIKVIIKPKKIWLGYSPLPPFLSIFRKKFDPSSLLGARWKINQNAQGEPTVQGSLVGRGSYMNIAVGLYTGTVRGVLRGKESWNVLYENREGVQIAELFWRDGGYEREVMQDADGNTYQTTVLAEGKTLFAATPEGTVFAVKPGALPDVLRGSVVARVAVPQNGPLIPVDKILDLLQKGISALHNIFFAESVAATKALGEQVADYKKIMDQMSALEQSFGQINFDDPNTDFDVVQNFIDRYETLGKALNAAGAALGYMRMFVRDVDWLWAENPAIKTLIDQGVAPTVAALIAQGAPPFDFYAMQGSAKKVVIAGSCKREYDAKGNQGRACAVRKISPAQAQLISAQADRSYDALIAADKKLQGIEQALFGNPDQSAE